MKKRIIVLSILTFISALIIISCKEDSPLESLPNQTELISKSWQLHKAFRIPTDSSNPVAVTGQMSFVYVQFFSDGTYTSSIQNGKWEFDASNQKILFDKNSSLPLTADILKLTADTLRIRIFLLDNEQPSLFEITFLENKVSGNKSAEINFDALWKEFDQRYSFFEIKRINWDSLYNVYRPQIKTNTTELELFKILSALLAELKDGHADLITPFGGYSYTGWYSKHPQNYLGQTVVSKYLSKYYGALANGYLRYGKTENNLGYIYIGPNFQGDLITWSKSIDVILDSLKNTDGLILDIRGNTGGSDYFGLTVAGRFTDQTRIYSYVRYRSGPLHSDLTDYSARTLSPQGKIKYLKPVALLTNRRCFSSAEGATLMFKSIPTVTVIGDTTGGGSANPVSLQLPNGWSYRVARWIQYTADRKVFEGKGLAPDIPVWITKSDSLAGKDVILEKAIRYLSK